MVPTFRQKDELMSKGQVDSRSYRPTEVVAFRKTNEDFGGLSNMAPGFPLEIEQVKIRTSEALYQACRFPHMPDVQRMIIQESSPMTAKMLSKPYREQSRADWEEVRIPIMRWCLRVKLLQNWRRFSELLLQTKDLPIVEDSRKDDYWGARLDAHGRLEGRNILGRMLMELRQQVREAPDMLQEVLPLRIENFSLYGRPLPTVTREVEPELGSTDPRRRSFKTDDNAPTFSGL